MLATVLDTEDDEEGHLTTLSIIQVLPLLLPAYCLISPMVTAVMILRLFFCYNPIFRWLHHSLAKSSTCSVSRWGDMDKVSASPSPSP